ncbi:uncharacterized protein LOC143253421 isoform X2 [Tachypleus tridentatus]|uniref:uncharacterized protein LOC143253421 isoform X2 n=1 Tax=Tachypleus tridentatus TaxID=6853 RepID=UPI003FD39EB5
MHPGGFGRTHTAASAYPQLHNVPQQARGSPASLPNQLGMYGLASPLIPTPPHAGSSTARTSFDPHGMHSQSHRQLIAPHPLLPNQYAHSKMWSPHHPNLLSTQFMVSAFQDDVLKKKEREMAFIQEQLQMESSRGKKEDKERLEQQKFEKELEKEKAMREKHQRLEKEWQERQIAEQAIGELGNKSWEEKERAQREVQLHFEESLRLANNKKNSGWSHISNLPLTKQASGQRTSPALNRTAQLTPPQLTERDLKERRREWAETRIEEKFRMSEVDPGSQIGSRHLIDHQRLPEPMHHTAHILRHPSESHHPGGKSKPESSTQRMNSPRDDSKVSVASNKATSQGSPLTNGITSKAEPSFNIYGYQGYQPMYLLPSQLKSREAFSPSTEKSVMHQSNYGPLPLDNRHCILVARSSSLLHKQQNKSLPEHISAKGQQLGDNNKNVKSYEYPVSQPIPAHQNSSSPILPGRAGTPQYQLPTQEQPQNLVKGEFKKNKTVSNQSHHQPASWNPACTSTSTGFSEKFQPATAHSKCSVTAYPSSLIQAGLVPNPLYSSGAGSNSTVKNGNYSHERTTPINADIGNPNSSIVQPVTTCAQISGITTGIPVCKSNQNSKSQTIALCYAHSLMSESTDVQKVKQTLAETSHNSLALFQPDPLSDKTTIFSSNYASPTLTPPAPSPVTIPTPVRPNSSPAGPFSSNIFQTENKRKSPKESCVAKKQKKYNDTDSLPQNLSKCSPNFRKFNNSSPLELHGLNMSSKLPVSCGVLVSHISQDSNSSVPSSLNSSYKKENESDSSDFVNDMVSRKVHTAEEHNSVCFTSQYGTTANHPKLKKAWLKRHSENTDKKLQNEAESVVKNPGAAVVKLEDLDKTFHSVKLDISPENAGARDESSDENQKESKIAVNGHQSSSNSSGKPDSAEDGGSTSDTEQESSKLSKRKTRISQRQTSERRFKLCGVKRKNLEISEKEQQMLTNSTNLKKVKEENQTHNREVNNYQRKGRKPRRQGNAQDNSQTKKNSANLKEKSTVAVLKKTGESFLQNGLCGEIASKLPKCRECRMTPHQRNKKMPNIFCRFYAFRKLKYSKTGSLVSSGFSEPSDAAEEDLRLWMPSPDNPPDQLDIKGAKLFLESIGEQFYYLLEQEKKAQALHMNQDKTITWKRVVQNVREMCDVCEATLFNIHWVCHKCGFVVCIECYRARKNGTSREEDCPPKDRDECQWLLCNNRQPHDQEKLMLTQIIPGTALWDMGTILQDMCTKWNISTIFSSRQISTNGICKQLINAVNRCLSDKELSSASLNEPTDSASFSKISENNCLANSVTKKEELNGYSSESDGSPLSWLADVALGESTRLSPKSGVETEDEKIKFEGGKEMVNGCLDKSINRSTLRELLIRPSEKGTNEGWKEDKQDQFKKNILESTLVNKELEDRKEDLLLHFARTSNDIPKPRRTVPIRSRNLTESSLLHPDIPHSWLCNGQLLRLHDPQLHQNLHIFQDQWKQGQPVMVSNLTSRLDSSLWHPDSFAQEFGGIKTEFLDCNTGEVLTNQLLRKFWDGFENTSKRMKNKDGEIMVLKLKEWPPGEAFREHLPSRYDDLIKALPIPEYTQPGGIFNLAGRLPEGFIQPDLGFKMCSAYGSTPCSTRGTTCLHFDVCDIINIMVYADISCESNKEYTGEVLKAIEEGGCHTNVLDRVKAGDIKPVALWHIYSAEDADHVRDFLNKIAKEKGEVVESSHDPLVEQNWYLDKTLRERLTVEYGVESFSVIQCLGDAILLPAGSPHQVQNLYSCIKVSADFISPEHLSRCFFLTQELRNSPETSSYQEDRLQIKNVIYHAVKDALSVLLYEEGT